jgi:hypothetical protein
MLFSNGGAPSTKIRVSEGPLSPPYPGPFDIPVLLDDVKHLDNFTMTRFAFFTIEAATAIDDWVTLLRVRDIPFLLIGISSVIHRPDLEATRFTSPEQIDRLFNVIEEIEGLVCETAHIWLPNFLFEGGDKWDLSLGLENSPATRGAVWRVSFGLFQNALRFRQEVISAARFSEACHALLTYSKAPVTHSPKETAVFREWSIAQIDAARYNYEEQRKDPSRGVLNWLDESGQVRAG